MGIYRVGDNGSAPKGLKAGDQVVTGGGTYRITGVDSNGGYTSELFNKDQTTYNYKGAYDRAPDSTQVQVQQNMAAGAAAGNAASAFSASMNNYANQIKNYSDPYAGAISKQSSVVQNYAPFSYEKFTDPYADAIAKQSKAVQDYKPFEYDPYSYDQRSDIRAANVKQTGTREIRRAVEDTLGNYAANTGGQASTAAASAAAQAGDYYAAQLTDQLNDVENEAYDRYNNERNFAYNKWGDQFNMEMSKLNSLENQSNTNYARWSADRDFAYNQWANQFNVELSKLSSLQSLSNDDFDRFLSQLSTAAQLEGTAFEANFEVATVAAQYGDYSMLNAMGVDTTAYQKAQASDAAAAAGMTGLYYKVGADGWAPEGMSVGDYVVTGGGTYMVTGYNPDGSYQSKLVDKGTTPGTFTGYYANASNPNYVDPYTVALAGGGSSGGSGGGRSSGGGGYRSSGGGYSGEDDSIILDTGGGGQKTKNPNYTPSDNKAATGGGNMSYNDLARWLSNNAGSVTVQDAADKIARNANNLTTDEFNALRKKYVGA